MIRIPYPGKIIQWPPKIGSNRSYQLLFNQFPFAGKGRINLCSEEDEQECTFIVLDKQRIVGDFIHGEPHVEAMAGDVNLYMNDPDDLQTAEIEIMIADPESRGKGLGKESVLLMIAFATEKLEIHTFSAKIGDTNIASLHLFRNLGFRDVTYSEAFKEMTLELSTDDSKFKELRSLVGELKFVL